MKPTGIIFITDDALQYLDVCASIWAEATAARDNDPDIATLEEARPVLQRALDADSGSFLLVAFDVDKPVAFAAVTPSVSEMEPFAEIFYLGVAPSHWGRGIAEELLNRLSAVLATRHISKIFLSVYTSNQRAVALYERAGWRKYGALLRHTVTGKAEQRYCYNL